MILEKVRRGLCEQVPTNLIHVYTNPICIVAEKKTGFEIYVCFKIFRDYKSKTAKSDILEDN